MSEKGFPVTMSQCFWCGEAKNEILIGTRAQKSYQDVPRMGFHNYNPCDQCEQKMELGVTLVEVKENPVFKGQPVLQQRGATFLYPTGNCMVVRPEAVDKIFGKDAAANIKQHGKAFIDSEVFQMLQGGNDEQTEQPLPH